MMKMLFSAKGRINRAPFWGYSILAGFVLQGIMMGLIMSGIDILAKLALLVYIPMIWINFSLVIKRLHDLNKNGWMSLLMLVPLANLYLLVICGFFKGTTGKNQYGEDPLGGTNTNNQDTVEL